MNADDVSAAAPGLVSIIVPVWNRAHLVARSIGCLCAQSYADIEILVVDDASSDDIAGALDALGDARIRLIRRARNGGAAAARNTGIHAARGALIAFHDSDDICTFDKVARQVAALAALPDDHIGVYCCRLFYSETDLAGYRHMRTHVRPAPESPLLSGDLWRTTLHDNILQLPTLLVRRDAVLAAGAFDEKLRNNEDWDLSLRLTRQGRIGFVPEPLFLTPTPVGRPGQPRVSRDTRATTRSFLRITGKLRRAGVEEAAILRHYETLAASLMRERRTRFARRFLRRVLRRAPLRPRALRLMAFTVAPGLHERLRQWRRR